MQSGSLVSNILQPGFKFTVTEAASNSIFGPGTTGFMSYVKGCGRDYPNVAYIRCSIIRRGKNGKQRLEIRDLSHPIFVVDDDKFDTSLPDNRIKYFVKLEPAPLPVNMMEADTYDFLGWGIAYCKYIKQLNNRSQRVGSKWPESNEDCLNRMLYADSILAENQEWLEEYIDSSDNRIRIIQQLRILESTLRQVATGYMVNLVGIEVKALNSIKASETKTEKILQDTVQALVKKEKNLLLLAAAQKQRPKE